MKKGPGKPREASPPTTRGEGCGAKLLLYMAAREEFPENVKVNIKGCNGEDGIKIIDVKHHNSQPKRGKLFTKITSHRRIKG